MERQIGVEDARGSLGRIVDEVGAGGEPVVLSKRGRATAVLMGASEYGRLKQIANERARGELADRLAAIRASIRKAGLDESVVDEAIAAARRL
jgi:prevent-host-death family protein